MYAAHLYILRAMAPVQEVRACPLRGEVSEPVSPAPPDTARSAALAGEPGAPRRLSPAGLVGDPI